MLRENAVRQVKLLGFVYVRLCGKNAHNLTKKERGLIRRYLSVGVL